MIKVLFAVNLAVTAFIAVHLQLQITAIESGMNHFSVADSNSAQINDQMISTGNRGEALSADLYVESGLDNLATRSSRIGSDQPLSVNDSVREQNQSDVRIVSPETITSDMYSDGKQSIGGALSPDDVNAYYDVNLEPRDTGKKLSADLPYANN